jgi:hypothetical protein
VKLLVLATLTFGVVLGSEAPLIALGSGLGVVVAYVVTAHLTPAPRPPASPAPPDAVRSEPAPLAAR